MNISNISHLEVVAEENSVTGGIAVANAWASASANGPNFAGTYTNTYTNAYYQSAYYGYYYYQPSSYNAYSSANSSSSAG